jgi:folate-dependent phosphoribosylglycinamide formyltransferase PurN
MRIVMLCSSIHSETACATAAHLGTLGHAPVGVLSLRTLNSATLRRKLGQWGPKEVIRYARNKLVPAGPLQLQKLQNPCLHAFLNHGGRTFPNLKAIAKFHGFPIAFCANQNSSHAIACLKSWSPDLIVFAGGNILREELLAVPRLGALNVHLGLLPEVGGMSSPEWSLLNGIPAGITIHYMDTGVDTGPILKRYQYPASASCASLADLRHRLIAFGVEKLSEIVIALDRGTILATPQSVLGAAPHPENKDNQYFVMHARLQAQAAKALIAPRAPVIVETAHG